MPRKIHSDQDQLSELRLQLHERNTPESYSPIRNNIYIGNIIRALRTLLVQGFTIINSRGYQQTTCSTLRRQNQAVYRSRCPEKQFFETEANPRDCSQRHVDASGGRDLLRYPGQFVALLHLLQGPAAFPVPDAPGSMGWFHPKLWLAPFFSQHDLPRCDWAQRLVAWGYDCDCDCGISDLSLCLREELESLGRPLDE